MRTINIFGRRMPILAILVALLVIGTASAAVIEHYGELSGEIGIAPTITVAGDVTGNTALIDMADGEATFTINNVNSADEPVDVIVTLTLDSTDNTLDGLVTDVDGITMTIHPVTGVPGNVATLEYDDGVDGEYSAVEVLALGSGLGSVTTVTVTFDGDADLLPGTYTIDVDVDPVDV